MAKRSPRAFWVFFGLLVIAHFTLHVGFGIGGAAPDLLTVALLLAVRRVRGWVAALLGLALGLLNDAFSIGSFGADAVTMAALGYVGAWSRDLFEGDSLLFVGGYLFIGKWLHDFGYWMLTRDTQGDFVTEVLVRAPGAAFYAALAGIGALLLFRAATGEK